jgi:uncharacterized protein
MSTYMTPGVYVEEIPARNKPIEGVGTSVAAFVGLAPAGPLHEPVQLSSWAEFERIYSDPGDPGAGPFLPGAYLAHAVKGFFLNGGTLCWVVRVGGEGQPQAMLPAASNRAVSALKATALPDVQEDVKLDLSLDPPLASAQQAANGKPAAGKGPPSPPAPTYTLVVSAGNTHEKYSSLAAAALPGAVHGQSKLIELEPQDGAEEMAPAAGSYRLSAPAMPAEKVSAAELEGNVAERRGLGGLAAIEDITMVCVPDLMAIAAGDSDALRDIQGKVIAHCESMADRVAVLDTPPDLVPNDALQWRLYTAGYDSKQATLYYPWLEVIDPLSGFATLVPPCGHVAGVWARTDATRGVHKAPANEAVMGITGLGFRITDTEQGELNRSGLNCIRPFPAGGIRVWGARTLSSDPEWRYLNVRRLFNYISDSIMQGTRWAVFEPNDERLWMQLQIAVSNFLTISWRNGALFGSTPDRAFFVKCDSETNPPESIDAGQVVTEIGIAPVKPAEFVVFRISQYTAGEGSA